MNQTWPPDETCANVFTSKYREQCQREKSAKLSDRTVNLRYLQWTSNPSPLVKVLLV